MNIAQLLKEHGPTRSSRLATLLQQDLNISADAARKRVSREGGKVLKFPVPLLPKREAFLYLKEQRTTEQFMTNFLRDLRETNSIYSAALDGISARGGLVSTAEFAVISGAPISLRGQVTSDTVLRHLESAGFVERMNLAGAGEHIWNKYDANPVGTLDTKARGIAEKILLDGLREWARKLGLASYNKILIRGDELPRQVGLFHWDLTGPSYVLPLRGAEGKQGFLVADVFAEGILNHHHIKYFIRKANLLKATLKDGGALTILLAEGFTGTALTEGRRAGIVLATPENLFGYRVAAAMKSLIETLKKAATTVVTDPDRLTSLIDDLVEIEGAAGNLRGVLFELITAYLARLDSVSVELGVQARDSKTGKLADIDVLKITKHKAECVSIECKGKAPGGRVTLEETEDWISRIPTFKAHFRAESRFRESKLSFELWTTGTFEPDALQLLESEKKSRTQYPISWRDGSAVLQVAKDAKEKAIRLALETHFLRHPLSG